MEYTIGEIVTLPPYNIKARVVKINTTDCNGCYYQHKITFCDEYMMDGVLGECFQRHRKDNKNIIYKPLTEEKNEDNRRKGI